MEWDIDQLLSLPADKHLADVFKNGNKVLRINTVWHSSNAVLYAEPDTGRNVYGQTVMFAGVELPSGLVQFEKGYVYSKSYFPDTAYQSIHAECIKEQAMPEVPDTATQAIWTAGTTVMIRRESPLWPSYPAKIGSVLSHVGSKVIVALDNDALGFDQKHLTDEITYCQCHDTWGGSGQEMLSNVVCPHCNYHPWTYPDKSWSEMNNQVKIAKLQAAINSNMIDTTACIHNYYLLVALVEEMAGTPYENKLRRILDIFSRKFAKTLFDYCACICMGEARHAGRMAFVCIEQLPAYKDRNAVYDQHELIDPIRSAPALIEVFESHWSGDSYGGEKWAEVARCYPKYETLSSKLFIDMIINKQHNTGSIFNKPILFRAIETSRLKDFLDYRREHDLLNGSLQMQVFSETYTLIKTMQADGYVKRLRVTDAGPAIFPKPFEWGFIELETTDQSHKFCPDCGNPYNDCTCHNVCQYCGYPEDYCECGWCDECDHKEPECTCDICQECGYKEWECECSKCDKCGNKTWECTCDDEEDEEETTEEENTDDETTVFDAYQTAAGNCKQTRPIG